jgi:crotonobetainyl-CoA:carnitine CoA-transferase CaiB-like acyl-CoA transferase
VGVASALLACLYGKRRGIDVHHAETTMLGTAQNALIWSNISYPDQPAAPTADAEFLGLTALYRLYRAADGWVFLAAPQAREWEPFAKALQSYVDLLGDERFTDAASRAHNDDALARLLEQVFLTKTKLEWEQELTAQDVGCVEVAERNSGIVLQSDTCRDAGYSVEADSPIFDKHLRLAPLYRFSRSSTKASGGCTVGQHTAAILSEIGVDDNQIADLHSRGIIACG